MSLIVLQNTVTYMYAFLFKTTQQNNILPVELNKLQHKKKTLCLPPLQKKERTRFDVYETLCPQQMLVHKGGQIKNLSGESRDVIPTILQCQTIQRALQSPNLQREIIRKK